MDYKHDIFLSHNRADKAWAEHLATAIEKDRNPLMVVDASGVINTDSWRSFLRPISMKFMHRLPFP
jgi:hypothetical protein